MGIGFIPKWLFPVHSTFSSTTSTNSLTRQHFSSARGKEVVYDPVRVSALSVIREESETLCKDTMRAYTCSLGALQIIENGSFDIDENQMNFAKGYHKTLYSENGNTILRPRKTSELSLFIDNVERIEETFFNADYIRLERDILAQLGKLGALELFHVCLSRTLETPNVVSRPKPFTDLSKNSSTNVFVDDIVHNEVIQSGKKENRKLKRTRASEKAAKISLTSLKITSKVAQHSSVSTAECPSNVRSRRRILARKESEMATGLQEVSKLETIRSCLEKESGRITTYSHWSEAAGIDTKTLKDRLQFGWFCRDELLRTTRSLVIHLARNYQGLGVSFDDLLQAGKLGVLKGAERFDTTRGYQFSTYVHYWIRKSMSTLVARHSRGIQLPMTMTRAINQIRKTRKEFCSMHGRYPDDDEISRLTGLPLTKVTSANKCPRFVGSIDQKVGDNRGFTFMEQTSDTSIKTPEEAVFRKQLQKDIYKLLQDLHPREQQVLILRYGIRDGQRKSLQQIARLYKCTKEWIWKVEKSAMKKLKKKKIQTDLAHYMTL